MATVTTSFATITCNGPDCKNEVTIQINEQGGFSTDAFEANPWLKTRRDVRTADGRVFTYCSDTCTVNGVATGELNAPEQKKIVETGNAAAVALAAQAARKQELANKALKDGKPVSLQVVGG